jgi:basic endochitinase B
MAPREVKPSMHEIATGLFEPNAIDDAAGITDTFGATTLVINGSIECGRGQPTQQATNRAEYFTYYLSLFDMPEQSGLGCENMQQFKKDGWGDELYANFEQGSTNECVATHLNTKYFLFQTNDYKRCV